MSIPDYQTIMLPLLRFASDGYEHASREPVDFLAAEFELSEDERKELLPSGGPVFADRVAWALSYMRQAGLLASTRRGFFKITPRGIDLFRENHQRVDNRLLLRYEEFQAFFQRSRRTLPATPMQPGSVSNGATDKVEITIQARQTPEELLDDAYQTIREALVQELLDRVLHCSPTFFERLVVELLVKMGYGGFRRESGAAGGACW